MKEESDFGQIPSSVLNEDRSLTDRRVRRTKAAIHDAFRALVMEDRKRTIRVSDVIEKANVGRSTFYTHYSTIDDLHLDLLAGPFGLLARGTLGLASQRELTGILRHFWENRYRVRNSFVGPFGEKAQKLLASLLADHWGNAGFHSPIPLEVYVQQIAAAQLELIRQWMMGRVSGSPELITEALLAFVQPLRRETEIERGD